MKSLIAAAVLTLTAGTAAAAPIAIRNCTGAPVDIQVRDAATPQGEVRSQIQNLPHGGTWSGQCSPASATCVLQVDRYLAGVIRVVTAGPVCIVPTTSDTSLPLPMNACPC